MTGWRRTATLLVVRNMVHGLTAITVAGIICLLLGQSLNIFPDFWLLQLFFVFSILGWLALPACLPSDALCGLAFIGLVLLGAWVGAISSVHVFEAEWPLLVGMALGLLLGWGLQKLYRRCGDAPMFKNSDPA
jgi:hypothetical protein